MYSFLFISKYMQNIIIFDFVYKLYVYVYLNMYNTISFKFSDFNKYSVYIFSRFFRNLRLNFNYFVPFTNKFVYKYMNKRKTINYLVTKFMNFSMYNFYMVFEYLIFNIFRLFGKYQLSFFGLDVKNQNVLKLSWNDIYSNILDLNDLIIFRDNFVFKFDIPRVVYQLTFCLYGFKKIDYYYILLSFFGFNFFFRKRAFRFKFFSRII